MTGRARPPHDRCRQCRSRAVTGSGSGSVASAGGCPDHGGAPCLAVEGRTLIERELEGRYTLLEVIATGGMGTIFRARQHATGRDVAIKLLPTVKVRREHALQQFAGEASALARLSDPHIVTLLDAACAQAELPYFVMELLRGTTLRELVAREGPLAPARALAITAQVLDALGHAHAAGVVHRDVKPENVMLLDGYRHRDFVKVLDFGVAWLRSSAPEAQPRDELLVGTPSCIAPEQITGAAIDPRADLYALGSVLFYLLAGQYPFEDASAHALMRDKLGRAAPRLSTLAGSEAWPVELDELVASLLERAPDDRPADADAARALLDGAIAALDRGCSAHATTPTPAPASALPRPGRPDRDRTTLDVGRSLPPPRAAGEAEGLEAAERARRA